MIPAYALILPIVSAVLWRFARGEGKWKRWQFYAAMSGIVYLPSFDFVFTIVFLLFVVGLAMPPHNALFCTVTGRPPARGDHWLWQWTMDISFTLARMPCGGLYSEYEWRRFGIIYGAIRFIWATIGIAFLCGYMHSYVPLLGLVFAAEGYFYYIAGKVARRYALDEGMGVVIGDLFVGWLVMVYGLICAGSL